MDEWNIQVEKPQFEAFHHFFLSSLYITKVDLLTIDGQFKSVWGRNNILKPYEWTSIELVIEFSSIVSCKYTHCN